MTTRHQIWLPHWVSNEVRQGLISPDGCHCSTFCAYYRNGAIGPKPSVFDICPLYFRDRSEWFTACFREDLVSFLDTSLTDEDNRKSIHVSFNDERVEVEFTRGPPIPGRCFEETFELFRDGRPIRYSITSPVRRGPNPVGPAEPNLERRLEGYLSEFLFPGPPH